jgi:hypothetical protein
VHQDHPIASQLPETKEVPTVGEHGEGAADVGDGHAGSVPSKKINQVCYWMLLLFFESRLHFVIMLYVNVRTFSMRTF